MLSSPDAPVGAPPLDPAAIADLLRGCLRIEVDAAALFVAQQRGEPVTLVDARTRLANARVRIGGALTIDAALRAGIDGSVVVYGWGDRRLDAVRGALALAERGLAVRILRGGIQGWIAEGFPVEERPTADMAAI